MDAVNPVTSLVSLVVAIMPRTKGAVHTARLHLVTCRFHNTWILVPLTAPSWGGQGEVLSAASPPPSTMGAIYILCVLVV